MKSLLASVTIATIAAFSNAPQTLAKGADVTAYSVHIDRQCYRYGHFCNKYRHRTGERYKGKKPPRRVVKRRNRKITHHDDHRKPFIERQCYRYGSFC